MANIKIKDTNAFFIILNFLRITPAGIYADIIPCYEKDVKHWKISYYKTSMRTFAYSFYFNLNEGFSDILLPMKAERRIAARHALSSYVQASS